LVTRSASAAPEAPPVDPDVDAHPALAADLGIELDENGVTLRVLRAAVREVGYVQSRHEIKRRLGE